MRARLFRYLHGATAPDRSSLAWFDLIEIGLVAFGFLLYFLVRGAVVERTGEALEHARWIISFQEHLGVFWEPSLNEWALSHAFLVRFFNFVYFWMDFPLIIGVGLVLFWRARSCYTLLRDALLISGGLALILYFSFPVAPPRYLPEWGFVDTLEQFANLSYQAQSMRPFVNPFAAVPSLHVGWAVLLVIVLFRSTRNLPIRVGVVGVLVSQTFAVMATANHFLFDAVVGTIVSLVALGIAVWLQRYGYPRIRAWFGRRARTERPRAQVSG